MARSPGGRNIGTFTYSDETSFAHRDYIEEIREDQAPQITSEDADTKITQIKRFRVKEDAKAQERKYIIWKEKENKRIAQELKKIAKYEGKLAKEEDKKSHEKSDDSDLCIPKKKKARKLQSSDDEEYESKIIVLHTRFKIHFSQPLRHQCLHIDNLFFCSAAKPYTRHYVEEEISTRIDSISVPKDSSHEADKSMCFSGIVNCFR